MIVSLSFPSYLHKFLALSEHLKHFCLPNFSVAENGHLLNPIKSLLDLQLYIRIMYFTRLSIVNMT